MSASIVTPQGTLNFDTFWSSITPNYQKGTIKNVIEHRPTLNTFFDNFAHRDTDGGQLVQLTAEYGLNNTTKFYQGSDAFAQEPSQNALPLIGRWRYIGSAVSVTEIEQMENSGKSRLFEILKSRMDAATRTINLILSQEIFSDGTNYGGLTIPGLAAFIPTTTTADPASGPVMGLSVAAGANAWWRNNAATTCGSFIANGPKGSSGSDLFLRMWLTLTDGPGEEPTGIISGRDLYESYSETLSVPIRYEAANADIKVVNGFTAPYMGKTWTWDRLAPAGRAYMVENACEERLAA